MDGSVEMNGLRTEIREIERGFARNPLLLKTYETPSGLEVRFDFQSALFQASTVREWLETYRAILEGVAAQPHASVAEISAILSDNQWQRIRQWNLTETNYPRDCNLNELFEQTVQRRGGAIAIRSDQGELSYSTFSDMVGRVAYALTESGVAPGQRVGLFMERSPELIASILAVIKAGAAYVPMDPAYPAERTRYIVEDSGIKVVLTESDLLDRLPKEIVKLTVRDALKRGPSNRAPHRNSVGPDSPACVIYTSGSTGQPKGGILSHRNIVRLVRNTNMTEFGDDELILQLTTICFDPSLAEIFGSLMNGGSLVIPPAGQLTVDQIADRIIAHGVTQVFTTPALLHLLIDERIDAFHSLRRIFTGGDVPSPTQVRRILESHPRCAVVNAYGPTENTTITTMHVITASDLDGTGIPIGRPISNTTVWITDANGKPVPPGMPGELLTGGDGVAIGYLNRPELTTDRSLPRCFRRPPLSNRRSLPLPAGWGDRVPWSHRSTSQDPGVSD
jgi:amino acid adenylation domain-containing protein